MLSGTLGCNVPQRLDLFSLKERREKNKNQFNQNTQRETIHDTHVPAWIWKESNTLIRIKPISDEKGFSRLLLHGFLEGR